MLERYQQPIILSHFQEPPVNYDSLFAFYQEMVGLYPQTALVGLGDLDTSVESIVKLLHKHGNKQGKRIFLERCARKQLFQSLCSGMEILDYTFDAIDTLKNHADAKIRENGGRPLGNSETLGVLVSASIECGAKWGVNAVIYTGLEKIITGLAASGLILSSEFTLPAAAVFFICYRGSSEITEKLIEYAKNQKLECNFSSGFTKPFEGSSIIGWYQSKKGQWIYMPPFQSNLGFYPDPLKHLFTKFTPLHEIFRTNNIAKNLKKSKVNKQIEQQPRFQFEIKREILRPVVPGIHQNNQTRLKKTTEIKTQPVLAIQPIRQREQQGKFVFKFDPDFSHQPDRQYAMQLYTPRVCDFVEQPTKMGISIWANNDKGHLQYGVSKEVRTLQDAAIVGIGLVVADFISDKFLTKPQKAKKDLAKALQKLEQAESKDWRYLNNWRYPSISYEDLIKTRKIEAIKALNQIKVLYRDNPEIVYACRLQHFRIVHHGSSGCSLQTKEDITKLVVEFDQEKDRLATMLDKQLEKKEWRQAKKTLHDLFNRYPDDYEIHLLQARFHDRKKEIGAAEKSLKNAHMQVNEEIRLANHIQDEWIDTGQVPIQNKRALAVAAAKNEKRRVIHQILEHYQDKIKFAPKNETEIRKRITEFQEVCRSAIKEFPDHLPYQRQLVTALELDKKYDEAITLQQAIYKSSNEGLADTLKLAWLFDQAGNEGEAITHYVKFIEKRKQLGLASDDANYYVYKRLKEHYLSEGELEKAKIIAEEQCKLSQHALTDEYDLGAIYLQLRDKKNAVITFETIINKFKKSTHNFSNQPAQQDISDADKKILSMAHLVLAEIYNFENEFIKAIDHFKHSLIYAPNDAAFNKALEYAERYLAEDRTVHARKIADFLLETRPEHTEAMKLQQRIGYQEKFDITLFVGDITAQAFLRYGLSWAQDSRIAKPLSVMISLGRASYHFGADMFFSRIRNRPYLKDEKWLGRKGWVYGNKFLQLVVDSDLVYSVLNKGKHYLDNGTRESLQFFSSGVSLFNNASVIRDDGARDSLQFNNTCIVRDDKAASKILNANLRKGHAAVCLTSSAMNMYEAYARLNGEILPTSAVYYTTKQIAGHMALVGNISLETLEHHPGVVQRIGELANNLKKKYEQQDGETQTKILVGIGVVTFVAGAAVIKKIYSDSQEDRLNALFQNTNTCIRKNDIDGAINFSDKYLELKEDERIRRRRLKLIAFRDLTAMRTKFDMDPSFSIQYGQKIKDYIKLFPGEKSAKAELEWLSYKLLDMASQHFKDGKPTVGVEKLHARVILQPDNVEAKETLFKGTCLAHIMEKKAEDVISLCSSRLRLNPDDTHALRYIGYAFLSKEDMDTAAQQFRKLISLKSDDADAHRQLSNIAQCDGEELLAVHYCQKAILLLSKENISTNSEETRQQLQQAQEQLEDIDQQLRTKCLPPVASTIGYTFVNLMVEAIENYCQLDMSRWHVPPMSSWNKHIILPQTKKHVLARPTDPRLFSLKPKACPKRPINKPMDPRLFSKQMSKKAIPMHSNVNRSSLK